LDAFYETNAQRNLLFTRELLRLFAAFQENRIPVATFKGPVLALSVHQDLTLREFSDLDLLVHEADAYRAEDILTACGYEADFPDKDYRSAFVSYQGQSAFRHSGTGISVDLHWQLSSRGAAFPIQSSEIWPRLEPVTIAGRTVPTLGRGDAALFLAAHGTKEGWRSLGWVCDFAELLRNCPNIDWTVVLDVARRSHCLRPLLLAVALAADLLDAPAPGELLNQARNNSVVRVLTEKAVRRMLGNLSWGELEGFFNGLSAHDRLRDRVRAVAIFLATRTVGDYKLLPLPKPLWSAYYFTRPLRLTGKAVKMVIRRS
jgi:hypothetical protein